MRIIIIDNATARDLAGILGTPCKDPIDRTIYKTEEKNASEEYLNSLVGKKVQIDDVNGIYNRGVITDRAGDKVEIDGALWYDYHYITGILS